MSYNITNQNKYFNILNPLSSNENNDASIKKSPLNSKSTKNYLKIIDLCSKKLSKKPNNKRALLLRASIYIKINKFEEAKNDLLFLLNDKNLASTAYYLLGIINKEINNYELALKYFTKSIELDNNNINAYFLRGAVNNILGDYKNAIKDYNDAIYKDTMNTDGKNIYKNISKIFTQTLNKQKKNSKKKQRRNSLINNRKNNYIIHKFQINYSSEKNKFKNKIKCNSEENNLKIKNFTQYNTFKTQNDNFKNLHNIFVNSTSNNFNFFIRNIAYKKANEKYSDTYNLLKEINAYLNEEDSDEKLYFNYYKKEKKEDTINNRNINTFKKSFTIQKNENISPFKYYNINSSFLTNNTSNEFNNTNKSPSSIKFPNNIYYNLTIIDYNSNNNEIYSNNENNKINDNQNIIMQNNNIKIEKKQNKLKIENNINIKKED